MAAGRLFDALVNRFGLGSVFRDKDSNRVELETALENRVPVIPVLVEGADFPSTEGLPRSLRPLTRRRRGCEPP